MLHFFGLLFLIFPIFFLNKSLLILKLIFYRIPYFPADNNKAVKVII